MFRFSIDEQVIARVRPSRSYRRGALGLSANHSTLRWAVDHPNIAWSRRPMASFALQSPPDARFRQVTLPKTGLVGIGMARRWLRPGASQVNPWQRAPNRRYRWQSSPLEYTDSSNDIIYQ